MTAMAINQQDIWSRLKAVTPDSFDGTMLDTKYGAEAAILGSDKTLKTRRRILGAVGLLSEDFAAMRLN